MIHQLHRTGFRQFHGMRSNHKQWSEDPDPRRQQYIGKSAALSLVHHAMVVKQEYITPDVPADLRRREFWSAPASEGTSSELPKPHYVFPETSLMDHLVDLYFAKLNCIIPVLHRPLFQSLLSQGLHLKDIGFGAVVLLVCALGARYSDDSRVILGDSRAENKGLRWSKQVHVIEQLSCPPVSLFVLQVYCVSLSPLASVIDAITRILA